MAIKCPHYGFSKEPREFRSIKSWRFRFYTVTMLECPNCSSVFNYYKGVSPRKGAISEFYIKITPRGFPRRKADKAVLSSSG